MKATACQFEVQALAAVLESRWPLGTDAALREHVSQCTICSEVIALADTFAEARQDSQATAALPDPSRVFWMAQMRARREALHDAARPILATQIAAFAWAIGLLIVCLGGALTWFQSTRSWMESVLLAHGILIAVTASLVLLIPTAAYFVLDKE
jgi:hypothetical protein